MKRIVSIACLLLLAACVIRPPEEATQYHDITQEDVLELMDHNKVTGAAVSVNGIHLGDPLPQVMKAFGPPDYIDEYPESNIVNVKYTNEAVDETALVFHVANDSVQRITFREGFNPHLINRSRIDAWQQHNMTRAFGKPDVSYDTAFMRVYEWHDLGLEMFHRRKDLMAFAIVPPQDE